MFKTLISFFQVLFAAWIFLILCVLLPFALWAGAIYINRFTTTVILDELVTLTHDSPFLERGVTIPRDDGYCMLLDVERPDRAPAVVQLAKKAAATLEPPEGSIAPYETNITVKLEEDGTATKPFQTVQQKVESRFTNIDFLAWAGKYHLSIINNSSDRDTTVQKVKIHVRSGDCRND